MLSAVGKLESVKPAVVIVRLMFVLAVTLPDVPVTVMVVVPGAALLLTLRVRLLVDAVLAGLNEAVTPLGSPEAAKLTVPENPLTGTTVIVLDPPAPGCTLRLAWEGDRVKLGGGGGPLAFVAQPAVKSRVARRTAICAVARAAAFPDALDCARRPFSDVSTEPMTNPVTGCATLPNSSPLRGV